VNDVPAAGSSTPKTENTSVRLPVPGGRSWGLCLLDLGQSFFGSLAEVRIPFLVLGNSHLLQGGYGRLGIIANIA